VGCFPVKGNGKWGLKKRPALGKRAWGKEETWDWS